MTTREHGGPDRGPGNMRRSVLARTSDDRPDSEVCGMCCRGLLPHRAVGRRQLPTCRACAAQPNDPVLLDWWLAAPRHKRREWITAAFGVDPADYSESHADADHTGFVEDALGVPAGAGAKAGNHLVDAGQFVLPVNTFWRLWADDHRLTHQ